MRFAGIKNGKIAIISNKEFASSDFIIRQIPEEFNHISSDELIVNYKFSDEKFINKNLQLKISDLKIAFVSNWKMECGIATYADKLFPEIIKNVKDYKLFVEDNVFTEDIYKIGNIAIEKDKIDVCWKRGESLINLSKKIKEYNPDIVFIQHEFGLFPNARYWLSFLTSISDFRVIATFHSIFHHKDKTIVEAAVPEIIVHLDGAAKVLKSEKKVNSKVYIIPHGCDKLNEEKLWNFYKSEHTFIQCGFSFRYKNFQHSIEATKILKEKYPDVFFTGILSESIFNKVDHQIYYNELLELIEKYNLQENVSLIRGFQSDEVMDSYLRTNKAAVLPYSSAPGHEVFGASGIVRLTMSANIPTITSSIPHFSDVPTLKADTPEEIAKQLDLIFSDWKIRDKQLQLQKDYINSNSWEKTASEYIKIFETKF